MRRHPLARPLGLLVLNLVVLGLVIASAAEAGGGHRLIAVVASVAIFGSAVVRSANFIDAYRKHLRDDRA